MSIIKNGIKLGATAAVGVATFEVVHTLWGMSLNLLTKYLKKKLKAKTDEVMNNLDKELKEKRSDSQPVDYSEVFRNAHEDDLK